MKICFVAPNIHPCLSKKYPSNIIGGGELQQIYISRDLQERGHEIHVVTQDFGQPDVENTDGITIYKTFKADEGLPGLRYFYPRLYKIWKALKRADADIYYTRTAGFLPGLLALFCRRYKKKYIFAGAHDTDFIPDQVKIRFSRDRLLYKYGLRRADAIIAQTNYQQKLLAENLGLDSVVIPNLSDRKVKPIEKSQQNLILWVSTIRDWKRPMQFCCLARSFPEEKFVMIGGSSPFELKLHQEIVNDARQISNLDYLGFQPLEKTEQYFDLCKVFINTSTYEGFPNTFLQAWRRGIPVISYVDPDNIITKNHLGWVVNSEEELSAALKNLFETALPDPAAIMDYYERNHSLKLIDKYCELLEELA